MRHHAPTWRAITQRKLYLCKLFRPVAHVCPYNNAGYKFIFNLIILVPLIRNAKKCVHFRIINSINTEIHLFWLPLQGTLLICSRSLLLRLAWRMSVNDDGILICSFTGKLAEDYHSSACRKTCILLFASICKHRRLFVICVLHPGGWSGKKEKLL